MTENTDQAAKPGMDRFVYGSSPPTPAASSAGASSPAVLAKMTGVEWCSSGKALKGGSLSRSGPQLHGTSMTSTSTAAGSTPGSSKPLCRPWERGDLLNRLSTFKSSQWFIMPKVLGPLACARRGWENVDGDLIACEACGAHLSFQSPSSWLQPQVKLIAETYSGQLDSGHKALCPWKGNPCAESLAQFPPSAVSTLIGGFDDRCGALLQFLVLPVISGFVFDEMRITRGPEIDRLLAKPPPSLGRETGTRHGSMDTANDPYFQAQRLISLCGWEPRFLPYVVDCEEHTSYSTRKGQSVKAGKGPHRMCEPSILLPSHVDRMDYRVSGQSVMIVSGLKCDLASAVLDCNLCGATVCLRNYTTVTRPLPLSAGLAELPEQPEKYTGALMRGVSAASSVEGWHTVEASVKEKDLRDEAGDAITIGGQKIASQSGALDLNLTIAGGPTPTLLGSFAIELPSAELAADSQKLLGKPEGSQMGGPAASFESFGPGFKGRRIDDGGSTVDRPQSRMLRSDSIEGTVVDLEGGEVDDGEVGRKNSYNGESSKRKRGGESPAADQLSYGVAITEPGCSNFVTLEADFEVDNPDSFTRNQQHLLLQEIYEQRILLAQPAENSVYSSSVIAVDTSYSKRENSMESVENFPQDSDIQGTAFSWEKSERVDDDEFNVLELAQQSTCHRGNIGEFHDGPSVPGISTSDEGGGDIVVENDAAAFSAAIGMGCGVSVGMSGGSVQMGVSHEAAIHGADLSVHRMESLTNDAELITEVTGLQRQSSESVPDLAMTARFVPDNIEQTNARNNPMDSQEAVPSVSVARVYSGVKQDESGQGESWESEKRGKMATLRNQTTVANDVVNYSVKATNAGGEDVHHAKAASAEPGITGAGSLATRRKGNRLGKQHRQREQGGEFDPIHQHHHYCPWVNGHVAAAGTGELNLKNRLCGWQLTIDALDRFHMQDQAFTAPMVSESVASMHKGIG